MTQVTVNTVGGVLVPASFPPNRRQLFYSGGANATFVTDDDLSLPDAFVQAIPDLGIVPLNTTPVTVTRDFFIINSGLGGSVIKPHPDLSGYQFGVARSHDTVGLDWKATETSPGVYNFTAINAWLDRNKAAGMKSLYTVYNTPSFHSARPNEWGPYNRQGGTAEPSNMASQAAFITALQSQAVARDTPIHLFENDNESNYVSDVNTRTGSLTTTSNSPVVNFSGIILTDGNSPVGQGIELYTVSNEYIGRVQTVNSATQATLYANAATVVTGSAWKSGARFSTKSFGALAQQQRTISQAAKAQYAPSKIISPALTAWDQIVGTFDDPVPYFASMMSASDGAGGTMKDSTDFIGTHFYGADDNQLQRINLAKGAAVAAGMGAVPIINTEDGVRAGLQSDYDVYRQLAKKIIINAGLGIKGFCIYSLGDPAGATTGYALLARPAVLSKVSELMALLLQYPLECSAFLPRGQVAYRVNGVNYFLD